VRKRSRWVRRGGWLAAALAAIVAVAAAAGKYVVAPAVVRAQLAAQAGEYWDGEAIVEDVDFRFFGPIRLGSLTLRDRAGRPWLRVGSTALTLRDLGRLRPVLSEIEVRDVSVTLHVANGRIAWPTRTPPQKPAPSRQFVDLRRVAVDPIRLAIRDDRGRSAVSAELAADVTVDDAGRLTARCRRLRGRLCGGPLVGRFAVSALPSAFDESLTYSAQAAARDANVPELFRLLGIAGDLRKGTAAGHVNLQGRGTDPNALRGRGQIRIAKADLHLLPGFRSLVTSLGGDVDAITGGNDVDADFTIRGRRVVFARGRMGNNVTAVKVDPGGWVDWHAGTMDLFVIGAVLRDVEDVLRRIPVIGLGVSLLGGLKDRVIGVRVAGRWSDPPSKLIRKEPVSDVTAGTAQFFHDVLGAGGRLGGDALGAVNGLFDAMGARTRPEE
jgi:hypothetical protein